MRYREECIGELVPRIYLPSVFVSTFAMVFLATYLSSQNVYLSLAIAGIVAVAVLMLVRPLIRRISGFEP